MDSILSNFARQAKELITEKDNLKRGQLLGKLVSFGLLSKESGVEDVLSIKLKDIMERRLQTVVFRKNLARSMSQARQFIVHEHISIGDRKITVPSYLVTVNEENIIQFAQDSDLADPEHSERAVKKEDKKTQKKDSKQKPAKTPKKETEEGPKGKEEKQKKKVKKPKEEKVKTEEPKEKEAKDKKAEDKKEPKETKGGKPEVKKEK